MHSPKLETRNFEKTEVEQSLDLALANVFDLAMEQFRQQHWARCREYLMLVLEHQPDHVAGNYLSARLFVREGRFELALPAIECCIQHSPKNSDFWDLYLEIIKNFGDEKILREALAIRQVALSTGSQDETIGSVLQETGKSLMVSQLESKNKPKKKSKKKSAEKSPKEQEVAFRQLVQLYETRKFSELENYARHLIGASCCTGFAWRFLGMMYLDLGRLMPAKDAMQTSLQFLPDDATAHFNYALLCGKLQEIDLAETHYRKAIQLNRQFVAAYNNLGNLLRSTRQFAEAELVFRKLIELDPNLSIAQFNLVNVLLQEDKLLIALKEAQLGVARFPRDADLQNALGTIYFLLRRLDEAIAAFELAIQLKPDYADAYNNLGSVHFERKHYAIAKPFFEKALTLSPKIGGALRCLGQISREIDNDHMESIRYTRMALELDPYDHVAHASLLFLLSEFEVLTAELLFKEHQLFGDRYDDIAPKTWAGRSRDPNKVLKVGFVSGDLYNHAVASFIGPLLKYLCLRKELTLYAYDSNDKEDHVTAKLKTYFSEWRHVKIMSDAGLLRQINEDEIDILFDLSSHTTHSRLTMFAKRAAPVQVSWIGYPGTTGLKNMDYFISDAWLTPIAEQSAYFTEKICNLPSSAPFEPEPKSPPVGELPALKNNYFTFGSFNRVTKINQRTIALWARLMQAVPGSKLFLGGMPSVMPNFDAFVRDFEEAGISRDRLEFFGRSTVEVYLDQYKHVDLCLDAFPYNGATTSLHGLWMGVPTLSIKGDQLVSRNGYSLMGQVGLECMVVENDDDFVARGVHYSQHLEELSDIRLHLRERCLASPKFQPELIAHYLYQAMRQMWQRWCKDLPPEAFEVQRDQ